MPMELRPSDVMAQWAKTLRKGTQFIQQIIGDVYESQRVSQVNRQLAYLEQSYQQYNESLPQQMFDVREQEVTGPYNVRVPSVVKKPFGQASLPDIEADEDKFFQSQLEYITKNTTNKKARQEMIQHLTMKHIQNKAIIARQWNVAGDHEAMASLNTLYSTVLSSNDSWEVKVSKISDRVDQMVSVGRLWKDEGEEIKAKATAAAQYSFAHNGAMTMMKETGDPATGEAWLKQNTPFYDGNPDAREQILADVRREFDYFAKTEDEALDVGFADLFIRADTIEKVDAALSGLRDTRFHDGIKKYNWTRRFLQHKEYLKNLEDLPEEPFAEFKKTWEINEHYLKIELMRAKEDGLPNGMRRQMISDMLFDPGGPRISPGGAKKMYADLDTVDDPVFVNAKKYIVSKTAGLDGLEQMRILNAFETWYEANRRTVNDRDVQNAVENFVDEPVQRNLNQWGRRTWQVLLGDKRVMTQPEFIIEDIQEGKYTGLVKTRKDDLDILNAMLLDKAQKEFPELNIATVYTDKVRDFGEPGTPVLMDRLLNVYAYKLEGKQLVLYRLDTTNPDNRLWVKEIKKEGQAQQVEDITYRKKEKLIYSRSAEPAEKESESIFEDWERKVLFPGTPAKWFNKKTQRYATDPDLIAQLDKLQAGK